MFNPNKAIEDVETVIVNAGKRPEGSKLKRKIVYVYDDEDEGEYEIT